MSNRLIAISGTIGAIIAFVASNYWSYSAGSQSGQALLIETMERYRSFYKEVQENAQFACDADRNLQGLYATQFTSMMPVIGKKISPPYDNPCPLSLPPPSAASSLKIHLCQNWDTWEDFLKDPDPHMTINISDVGSILYPIKGGWRDSLIQWHDQIETAKQKTLERCKSGKECTTTIELHSAGGVK
jgi:hypothetical protein